MPRGTFFAAGLIVAAAALAYSNSFRGPFIFDDRLAVSQNPTIRNLWPIGPLLTSPPPGSAVQRRPVANVSLAINFAISGIDVWSYHALNLAAHMLAALLLFGIVRRTLRLPIAVDRFGEAATPLALSIALLWAVHPLLSEAVDYIVQRTEVLAGLFYLLTLYCVIRAVEKPLASPIGRAAAGDGNTPPKTKRQVASRAIPTRPDPRPERQGNALSSSPSASVAAIGTADFDAGASWRTVAWCAAAVVACCLAIGSKEAALSAPVVVLLYDRIFLSASWRDVFRRRWGLYIGLAASWIVMLLVMGQGAEGSAVFSAGGRPLDYLLAQGGVITHYLRLCFWPCPLLVDYGFYEPQTVSQIAPYVLLIGGLLAASLVALRYQPWLGFLGIWFFAILAPSSSVVPLFQQIAAEKRMYLPLAAVLTAVVFGGYLTGRRLVDRGIISLQTFQRGSTALVAVAVIALGVTTFQRNKDYRTVVSIWADAAAKSPRNPRAYANYGTALFDSGQVEESIPCFRKALDLDPNFASAHNGLGAALVRHGEYDEAMTHFKEAIAHDPIFADPESNLGRVMAILGRTDEAIALYNKALEKNPLYETAHNNLGAVLADRGQFAEAIPHFKMAVAIKPDYQEAYDNLGLALASIGRFDDAIACYRSALEIAPDCAETHCNFGMVLANCGRIDDAVTCYRNALKFKPDLPMAQVNLARLLASHPNASAQDRAEAAALAQRAVELTRGQDMATAALDALAVVYAASGRFSDAAQTARQMLALAKQQNNAALVESIQSRISQYESQSQKGK